LEINLIIAGLCFLAYTLLATLVQKWPTSGKQRAVISLFHLVFFAGAGAVAGFFVSSSMDLHGPSPKAVYVGVAAGLVVGLAFLVFFWPRMEGLRELFATDIEWAETSSSAFLLAGVIMYCFIQAFKIPSGSMMDTLLIRDHLFVNKFIYGIRVPFTDKRILQFNSVKRGDIIVFECPPAALSEAERAMGVRKDFIKRAVGLPGDLIEMKDKTLYVNGVAQSEGFAVHKEPYIIPKSLLTARPDYQDLWQNGQLVSYSGMPALRDNFGPVTVPPGHYLVLGDNRDQSFDSRFWGPLPENLLKGKAWFVYWPVKRWKVIR
jgi:signal peptidase I